eukprot:843178_1
MMFPHQQLPQMTTYIPSNVPQPIMFVPIQQIQSLQNMQGQISYAFQTARLGNAMLFNHAMVNQNRFLSALPLPPLSMSALLMPNVPAPVTTDTVRGVPYALSTTNNRVSLPLDDSNAVTSPAPVSTYNNTVTSISIPTVTSSAPVLIDPTITDAPSDGFKCDHCDRVFVRKSNLNAHKRIHTDLAFVCEFCNKKFARKSNLQQHVRIHTDERPYPCTYCRRTFGQQHSLNKHLHTHTGEKPHRCIHCNKRFSAKCNLTVHLRTHTGDKSYECAPCNKKYASKSGYNAHMRKFHRVESNTTISAV